MWALHPLTPVLAVEALAVWAWWGWTVFVRRARIREAWLLGLFVGNFGLLAAAWLVRLVRGTLPPG